MTKAILDPSVIRNKEKRKEIVLRREQLKNLIVKKARLRRKKEEEADPKKKEVSRLGRASHISLTSYATPPLGTSQEERAKDVGEHTRAG